MEVGEVSRVYEGMVLFLGEREKDLLAWAEGLKAQERYSDDLVPLFTNAFQELLFDHAYQLSLCERPDIADSLERLERDKCPSLEKVHGL